MKTPTTYRALSSDLREATRLVLEPGEVVVWEALAQRREVPLVSPGVVRGAVWMGIALVTVLAFVVSQRWWGGLIAGLVLVPLAVKLRDVRAWLGPLRRPYYAVTDRRLVLVEPGAYFGVEPGVTSYRAENLPEGGTLKEHRRRDDLCLRYTAFTDPDGWYGLRAVPEADRVEVLLAELKGRG